MTTPPLAQLEESFIHEYLATRGHDRHSVETLSAQERDRLLRDASVYASGRLSELETRSQFVHGLHDAIGDVPKSGRT